MGKIRVLVVEDSLTVRRQLCAILTADPGIELVGEAGDGKTAIELCQKLRPDCITLDMMLPVMSGVATTEYIMAHCPTPILIVSASTNRGELFKTYDALAAGAVEVLEKMGLEEDEAAWSRKLVEMVKLVARIKVITHLRARLSKVSDERSDAPVSPAIRGERRARVRAIAVGASTGGPGALVTVLRTLPVQRIPMFIVLHIDEAFGPAVADWLDAQTSHRVRFARDGESLTGLGSVIIMAPPGRHLAIRDGCTRLTDDPERHSCRPSVDILFESIASELKEASIGCLLTGMGRDGASGLLVLRSAGAMTIAQDEATSVIYGMPREAAQMNAAELILPLPQIGPTLAELTQPREVRR